MAPTHRPDAEAGFYDLRLRQALLHALARRQFSFVYEPVYASDGSDLLSLDVQLRWTHPQLGDVAPDCFMPLLEEMKLAERVRKWALRQACVKARSWCESIGVPRAQKVAIIRALLVQARSSAG